MKAVLWISCALCLLAQASYAAKIYVWTDANGTTHYGEQPPKDVKAKLINTRIGHSDPVPNATSSVASGDASASNLIPPAKDPEACEMARKNLDTLNDSPRVKVPEADGSLRYMTPDEIQAKISEMQTIASENCD